VDAFYAAATAAGGTDNGRPGMRPQYHSGYYGAFVLDPEGNNVEAVCHHAQAAQAEPRSGSQRLVGRPKAVPGVAPVRDLADPSHVRLTRHRHRLAPVFKP
jgi:hypothetical protein